MDIQRFQNSPTGELLKVGKEHTSYYAFVPHSLGMYTPTSDIVYELSRADRALGELAGLSRMFPNPHLLIRPFIRREAVLSSRIEGTQSNLEDLYRYEIGQNTANALRPTDLNADVREVYNYVRALEYGIERLNTFPLSLRFIRELHAILLEGVRGEYATPGEFRKTQNWIGAPGSTLSTATYVPPPVADMQEALHRLEGYLHQDVRIPPLIRLALIHYQFEAIHPFIDGNGRIGRLLITLLLIHWQILSAPLLYLSAYFEKHRQQYYDLLLAVSERGAWDEWVHFFLHGVVEEATDGVQRARNLEMLQTQWRSHIEKERLSVLAVSVLDFLLAQPIVTAMTIRTQFDVPHNTAIRLLRRFVDLGILYSADNNTRNQQFIALDLIRVLNKD